MEAVTVLDRHAEAREERARKSAELLLWWDCLVTVVEEIRDLMLQALVMGEIIRHVADVMVGAHEHQMVGPREERPDGFDLGSARFLAGAEGVEADDDERVDFVENACIERSDTAIICHTLDFCHRQAGQRLGQFDEGGKIPLHDVVKESCYALVESYRISQFVISRIAHPATFKERWKAILDHLERCLDLARPAPGVG